MDAIASHIEFFLSGYPPPLKGALQARLADPLFMASFACDAKACELAVASIVARHLGEIGADPCLARTSTFLSRLPAASEESLEAATSALIAEISSPMSVALAPHIEGIRSELSALLAAAEREIVGRSAEGAPIVNARLVAL